MLKISVYIIFCTIIIAIGWGTWELVDPVSQTQTVIVTSGLSKNVTSALYLLIQNCGLGVIGLGVSSIYILFTSYRHLRRGAWIVLFFTANLVWGVEAVLAFIYGDMVDFYMLSAGLAVSWLALLLPIRQFFGQKTTTGVVPPPLQEARNKR